MPDDPLEKESSRGLLPSEVARIYRVSVEKVYGWIKRGQLAAINVARVRCGKPRFVILPHALKDFERKMAAETPWAPPPPRRKRYTGKDYFPDL